MVENVDEIVRKLTKADRTAILRSGGSERTAQRLFDLEIFDSFHYDTQARYAFLDRPTMLGEAVRARLNSLEGEGGGG